VFLPKHHGEAGRVGLYESYLYFTGFVGLSQRVEAGNGTEEEEVSGAWWKTQHHMRERDQSHAAAIRSSRFGPRKGPPSHPHFIVSVARVPGMSNVERSPNPMACECRWSRTWLQKLRCNASPDSAIPTRSGAADTHPGASHVGGFHLSGGCSTPLNQRQCCGCGGNHTANYGGCVKWKESKAALV
jgi:hypothetical protein